MPRYVPKIQGKGSSIGQNLHILKGEGRKTHFFLCFTTRRIALVNTKAPRGQQVKEVVPDGSYQVDSGPAVNFGHNGIIEIFFE